MSAPEKLARALYWRLFPARRFEELPSHVQDRYRDDATALLDRLAEQGMTFQNRPTGLLHS